VSILNWLCSNYFWKKRFWVFISIKNTILSTFFI